MSSPKIKYACRDQIEMHVGSLDQLLPPDHPVREVWAYVEKMNIDGLLRRIRSVKGEAGAPAFDPRTLICLWLYATIGGVSSARELSRLCEVHLVYRWITGGDSINYHTLASFRGNCGKELEALLVASLGLLQDEGFINLKEMTVAHDGMRVRASAGRDSMHRRGTIEESLQEARHYYQSLKERDTDPEEMTARRAAARDRAARERIERLEESLKAMEKLEKAQRVRTDRKPRELRASTTDPDAGMLRMANGGKDVAHNIQFTVEVDTRVVTSVHVPLHSSDTGTLVDAMKEHERLNACLPNRVLADQGFFKYDDIAELERTGCEVLLPDLYPKSKRVSVAKRNREYIDNWKERIESGHGKEVYKKRPSTVEWVNARARQRGLIQLPVRGLVKTHVIGLWHALTHNVERTISLRRQKARVSA